MFAGKKTDNTTYNYVYTDENGRICCIPIHAGEYGWTEVTIATMQKEDHREALGNRYYEEAKNPLVEWKKYRFQDANNDDTYQDPMDELSDRKDDVDAQIYDDAIPEGSGQTGDLEKLRTFIATLSPEQKQLYEELYVKNKSNRALAKEIGVTEGTIRYRHGKLIKQLRGMFEK